ASSTRSSTTLPATACRSQRTWTRTRMPPSRSPAGSPQPRADGIPPQSERLAPSLGAGRSRLPHVRRPRPSTARYVAERTGYQREVPVHSARSRALDAEGDEGAPRSGAGLGPCGRAGVERELLGVDRRDEFVHDLFAEVACIPLR